MSTTDPSLTAPSAVEPSETAVLDPAGPPSPPDAARFEISYPEELNRWLRLVKWLLAFPHYFALFFVAIGALFVLIYAFFAVLSTGRCPAALSTNWSGPCAGRIGSSPTST